MLICDPVDSKAIESMRDAGIQVDVRDDISPEDLLEAAPEYDAMVVRSRTKITAAVIDAARNLRVIVRGGVGVDNIDVGYANTRAIKVLNTPNASAVSVAELTVGYLFALARQIPQMAASMKAGKWEKKKFEGRELTGKTLGLIGCGRIGQEVAARASELGMEVIFYRRTPTQVPGARQTSLDEVLTRSDYISIHTPLTKETRNIIDASAISKMKQGVYILNCSRGGTLDEEALYRALVSGTVAGAALDVYAQEPPTDRELIELPNVISSPHVGAATREAQDRIGAEVAQLLIEFQRAGAPAAQPSASLGGTTKPLSH